MTVITVGGALFCGVEDGCGVLQGQLDSIELQLHSCRASKLKFDLAAQTLDLNSLLLDEALLFLNLAAKCARTGHLASFAFVMSETCPRDSSDYATAE
jgi:hypothetical protein